MPFLDLGKSKLAYLREMGKMPAKTGGGEGSGKDS